MDAELIALAREYHERCESYDRTVCTGPMGRDGILPATPRELALIGRHARQVRDELMSHAGVPRDEWQRAINVAHQYVR